LSNSELSNIDVELAVKTLLVYKRLGDDATKILPPAKVEHLNKDLVGSAQTIETTLNANTTLSEKMKE